MFVGAMVSATVVLQFCRPRDIPEMVEVEVYSSASANDSDVWVIDVKTREMYTVGGCHMVCKQGTIMKVPRNQLK